MKTITNKSGVIFSLNSRSHWQYVSLNYVGGISADVRWEPQDMNIERLSNYHVWFYLFVFFCFVFCFVFCLFVCLFVCVFDC